MSAVLDLNSVFRDRGMILNALVDSGGLLTNTLTGQQCLLEGQPQLGLKDRARWLEFSGTEFALCPDALLSPNWTVSAWIRPSDLLGIQTIVSAASSNLRTLGAAFALGLDQGLLTLSVSDYRGQHSRLRDLTPLGLGQWHHCAASCQFLGLGSRLSLYRDGARVSSLEMVNRAAENNLGGVYLAASCEGSDFLRAAVLGLQLWSTALTEEELFAVYQKTAAKLGS